MVANWSLPPCGQFSEDESKSAMQADDSRSEGFHDEVGSEGNDETGGIDAMNPRDDATAANSGEKQGAMQTDSSAGQDKSLSPKLAAQVPHLQSPPPPPPRLFLLLSPSYLASKVTSITPPASPHEGGCLRGRRR